MKNLKKSRRGGTRISRKTTADLLRLIHRRLMSPQGGAHTDFTRVNLEGSNVGSTMMIRRAGREESDHTSDWGPVNVYVSNNIQGVNNSILVGSSVQMGNPGVQFSLGDEQLHWMNRDKKVNGYSILTGSSFFWFMTCFAIAILFFLVTVNKTS